MNVEFRKSFEKDLRKLGDAEVLAKVQQVIEAVEIAADLSDLNNLKKLESEEDCYRIRIGDHRIGITANGDIVTFVRVLHRKEIYRYFPCPDRPTPEWLLSL